MLVELFEVLIGRIFTGEAEKTQARRLALCTEKGNFIFLHRHQNEQSFDMCIDVQTISLTRVFETALFLRNLLQVSCEVLCLLYRVVC